MIHTTLPFIIPTIMMGQLLFVQQIGLTSFSSKLHGQSTVRFTISDSSKCGDIQLGSATWLRTVCGSWISVPDINAITISIQGLVFDLALWKIIGWLIAKYLHDIRYYCYNIP